MGEALARVTGTCVPMPVQLARLKKTHEVLPGSHRQLGQANATTELSSLAFFGPQCGENLRLSRAFGVAGRLSGRQWYRIVLGLRVKQRIFLATFVLGACYPELPVADTRTFFRHDMRHSPVATTMLEKRRRPW